MEKINVTIWNEYRHEKENPGIGKIYPEGLHRAIGKGIAADDLNIRYASLDEPEHGLTDEVIATTDVLIWWGHCAHGEVRDDIVAKVHKRVLETGNVLRACPDCISDAVEIIGEVLF